MVCLETENIDTIFFFSFSQEPKVRGYSFYNHLRLIYLQSNAF